MLEGGGVCAEFVSAPAPETPEFGVFINARIISLVFFAEESLGSIVAFEDDDGEGSLS